MPLFSFLKRNNAPVREPVGMASPADQVQAARVRARRRLIGAVVLLGVGIVGFPLLFETQPRPLPVAVTIEIPRKDGGAPVVLPAHTGATTPATITESADDAGREVPPPAASAVASAPASKPAPALAPVPAPRVAAPTASASQAPKPAVPVAEARPAAAASAPRVAAAASHAAVPPPIKVLADPVRPTPKETPPARDLAKEREVAAREAAAREAKEREAREAVRQREVAAREAKEKEAAAREAREAKEREAREAARQRDVAAREAKEKEAAAREAREKAAAREAVAREALKDTSRSDTVEKRYIVQVGAFADATAASEARARAEKVGVRAYTQVIETEAGRRIRVRVGPFANREEADKALGKLRAAGLPTALLPQ